MTLLIKLENTPRGPGYWKFNTSLLRDKDYCQKMNELLDIQMSLSWKTFKEKWELIKLATKGLTIQYSSRKKKAKNNELLALNRKLRQIQNWLLNLPVTVIDSEVEQKIKIQKDIDNILQEKASGAVIHSRAKFEFQGDRPTKYFIALEKRNYRKKTMYRLQKDNGKIITDPKAILREQLDFYQKLYTTRGKVNLSYLKDLEVPKISKKLQDKLDAPITEAELAQAVLKLPNNKCPSTDGLPIDWYKIFWKKISPLMINLYNEIIDTGEFHITARQGIISLMDKPDRDILRLKSWCSLTLLNSDYKIFSKVLAERFQSVLNTIASENQTGFIKGRYIAENLIKLMNLIEHCNKNKDSALLLSIDFHKAFDMMEWESSDNALKAFGVGEHFRKMVRILYNQPLSTVINNGTWLDWFSPSRGCRQGDPFSPLNFTVTLEILGIKLRLNPRIQGIKLNTHEMFNVQYADDMWLALQPTTENLNNTIEELQAFERFSGLSINFEKSVVYKLGPLRDSDAKFYSMKQLLWSDGPIKILGLVYHTDWEIMEQENYWKVLNKIKSILQNWSNRSLSLMGKITVINTLVASLLVYKFMSLLSPSEKFFNEYKRTILQFLWEDKPPGIRYNKLIQNYDKGGLKLVDIKAKDAALKATWPTRWFNKRKLENLWIYANTPVKDHQMWLCNLYEKDLEKHFKSSHTHDMTTEILKAWMVFNRTATFDGNAFYNTLVWLNSLIRQANEPYMQHCLVYSNINTISEIWNFETSSLFKYQELVNTHGPVMDVMLYNSLCAAIPPLWKQLIKTEEIDLEVPENNLERLSKIKKPSVNFYWQYIEEKYIYTDTCDRRWAVDLGIDYEVLREEWSKHLVNARKISNSTKLRLLQYKILNKTLTTNIKRSQFNKMVMPLCHYCQNKNESIQHLLYECQEVQKMWKKLQTWIEYFYAVRCQFSLSMVILNNYYGPVKGLINTLILILKQHIYAVKCKQQQLKFVDFIAKINYWYNIEKIESLEAGKMKIFHKKWKKYEQNM